MSRRGEDGSWYDVMQMCLNGHVITRAAISQPENKKKRCPDCGAETIMNCPQCGSPIQGFQHIPGVIHLGDSKIPSHCHSCGEPYPWMEKTKTSTELSNKDRAVQSKDIFVVHGHDEEMKQAVARTLSKLGLQPIILHERPNMGRTLMEKFEQNADLHFAVVLLSADDVAHKKNEAPSKATARPRQNVVLELGYFVGRLGRDRVFAMTRGDDLELPTDFAGVAYTPYDAPGHWRLQLVRELRAARYDVDANAIL